MGRDKALIEIDGRPMAARVAQALVDAGAYSVFCIGGDLTGLGSVGLRAHPNCYPERRGLGAIVTAFERALELNADALVVTPCDLIAPSSTAFERLVTALSDAPITVLAATAVTGSGPQPLLAAYRTGAAPAFQAASGAGTGATRPVLANLRAITVPDLDPRWLADADTPDALP